MRYYVEITSSSTLPWDNASISHDIALDRNRLRGGTGRYTPLWFDTPEAAKRYIPYLNLWKNQKATVVAGDSLEAKLWVNKNFEYKICNGVIELIEDADELKQNKHRWQLRGWRSNLIDCVRRTLNLKTRRS